LPNIWSRRRGTWQQRLTLICQSWLWCETERRRFFAVDGDQGCQIYLGTIYQNG
jgi:hypothetical protein